MTTSERVEEATRSLLNDQPDVEKSLEAVVEHDADVEGWTFDEIPLDSGQFGELVSRNIAEEVGDSRYQLADREAVRRAIDDAPEPEPSAMETDREFSLPVAFPTVDSRVIVTLAVGLLAMVVTRSLYFTSVFHDGYTVSPGNDPYFYRYWQAQLLARSNGLTDVGTLAEVGDLTRIRPLTHTLNWWFAELFGPDTVAALAPIVLTVTLGVVLYKLAVTLTADHRIALASLLLLALTPVHVVYTSLGFLEHRPYQYLWLAMLAFALVWLAVDVKRRQQDANGRTAAFGHLRQPQSWGVATVLALAVAASAHAWGGSPLTFGPVALYLALRPIADIRADIPPLSALAPTLTGIGVGSILATLLHIQLGWHESIAVITPLLVTGGGVAISLLATGWHRFDFPIAGLVVTEGVLAVIGVLLFRSFRPEDVSRLQQRADDLFGRESATETSSLFTADQGIIFEPLAQLGIGFFLALAPLVLVTWYVSREYEPGWLVVVPFTWYYLVLAAIQVRFAAQFAIFVALFGGVAFVYLLGAAELIRKPILFDEKSIRDRPRFQLPDEYAKGAYLAGAVVLLLLFNLIFVPSLLGQIQYTDDKVDAMAAIDDHAENHVHREFVLSRWGENRMYNYFVSGESRGYGYARNNYEDFITAEDPDSWYDRFEGQVGYVVLGDLDQEVPQTTTYTTLFEEFGAGNASAAHYQLLYSSDDARAFIVVPGATITIPANAGENVTASAKVTIAGESFTYKRIATADENGQATIRVAYPGEYEIGAETVRVTNSAILNGTQVPTGE